MRAVFVAVAALALAACSESTPAPTAAPETAASDPAAARAPDVTDANAMTTDEISQRLVGVYRSTDDEKATITFTADGKYLSHVDGELAAASEWKVFTGDQPPAGTAGPFTAASRYLEVRDDDGVFHYELGHVAADGFDMFYTARGNRLAYERVP